MRLEKLQPRCVVEGVHPSGPVTVVSVQWYGSEALELAYKTSSGTTASDLLYRGDEDRLRMVSEGRPWGFDGDGALFRLVSEARRIRLAHLFDPVLALHTSQVEPLPHQITAVYQEMLPRQPLRFLLADDPGAGKTIMAGLLMKELIARGDLERCLIVCPGSLAEQWQDELYKRFRLPFEILSNDKLRSAPTGNWFLEARLVIARLDKLSRNEDVQQKLQARDASWDLVVCDEAHKMSARYFGSEIKYTKRYRLGQLLSQRTRNLLLMTATPHNGKEEDFQLFMGLLDPDRFEGRFRDGVHRSDTSDLMRRMLKERLLRFNGKPLFPERIAHTVPYKLSDSETRLYKAVTDYVSLEYNRAEALNNAKGSSVVGFALTLLQRRLASSPRAIHRSLRRRRERLASHLEELRLHRRGNRPPVGSIRQSISLGSEDFSDLEDFPDQNAERLQDKVLDWATAAQSVVELRAEIETLRRLESLALAVLESGEDTKWKELASLLGQILMTDVGPAANASAPDGDLPGRIPQLGTAATRKLVIFTEHRDTLDYLRGRIGTLIGRETAVIVIDGSVGWKQRIEAQEAFRHDPKVQVLLATDAAGEGINLQRAHLMVNYDLPWNPNRLEQRFGRIHRIGQTEVCHLWNLVADDTREGDVYQRLLEKLDQARASLGGQVFDVLGKLEFKGKPLRDLLLEAIRYGERPEVRAHLDTVVDGALDLGRVADLLEEGQIAVEAMDTTRVQRIREEMERAEARRLQPHYVESFFLEAYKRLGGVARQREPHRYELKYVPSQLRIPYSEVRAHLDTVVDGALDLGRVADLLEEGQIAVEAMDTTRVQRIREEMERAEARRLQPHYVESFFLEAYKRLGGVARQREPHRYELKYVPSQLRIPYSGAVPGEPIQSRYERVVFEKDRVAGRDLPPAAFVCPGHPLLDAVVSRTLERHPGLLKRGTALVDDRDYGMLPRVVFFVEHALRDGNVTVSGGRRVISKRVLYIELHADKSIKTVHYPSYLDYRPLTGDEPEVEAILKHPKCGWIKPGLEKQAESYAVSNAVPEHLREFYGMLPRVVFFVEHALRDGNVTVSGGRRVISKRVLYIELHADKSIKTVHYPSYLDYRPLTGDEPEVEAILKHPKCGWIKPGLEKQAESYAVSNAVPEHLREVRKQRLGQIDKTEKAVKRRLYTEINHWDRRAEELKEAERAGQPNARLNSREARKRADALQARLRQRLELLLRDRQISPAPPIIVSGLLVIPRGLLDAVAKHQGSSPPPPVNTQESAARARQAVMDTERRLGFEPTDREVEKLGYDIESRVPETGSLRFIEVKGRVSDAKDITVTHNEVLTALNKPESYILAIVLFRDNQDPSVRYVRRPFRAKPDFGVTSVKYNLGKLLAKAEEPS